jgi:hypothetical protein
MSDCFWEFPRPAWGRVMPFHRADARGKPCKHSPTVASETLYVANGMGSSKNLLRLAEEGDYDPPHPAVVCHALSLVLTFTHRQLRGSPVMNFGRVIRVAVVCISIASSGTPAVAGTRENRCGWLENPTPANWWLDDKDRSWTFSVMGERPVPGFDDLPDMTSDEWVVTNVGGHGYGCACIDMEVDKAAGEVVRVYSAKVLPLKRCKTDRSLPPP